MDKRDSSHFGPPVKPGDDNLRMIFGYLRMTFMAGLFLSCSHGQITSDHYTLPKGSTIAVLPFQNLTSYPRSGRIVGEIMALELTHSDHVKVLDPSFSVSKISSDLKLTRTDEAYRETDFSKISDLLKSTHLLYGSVSEYRYTKGLAENPSVSFQVKLFDIKTKQVVWRASVSDVSTETLFRRSQSIDELTHKLCASIIQSLRH